MNNIAIIGSAGRKTDATRINEDMYEKMIGIAEDIILNKGITQAVSGGAAFADHVAVSLYLKGKVDSLLLFLPAFFHDGKYIARKGVKSNVANTTNFHHENFSAQCGLNSLDEIDIAIKKGAKIAVYDGFKRRNLEVAAAAKNMLAFTFGNSPTRQFSKSDEGFSSYKSAGLKDGGTAFHGLDDFAENRRNLVQTFLPTDPGFSDAKLAGLKDGGTAHCWGESWRAERKFHVNLFELAKTLDKSR